MQGHGDRDMTVQYLAGSNTAEMIKTFNPHNHKFHTYEGMGHSSCPKVGGRDQSYVACLQVCVLSSVGAS